MNAEIVLEHLVDAGQAVWRASWQASVLALLVFAVQLAFGRKIPARWRHVMWMLVLVRLALPVVPSSPLSVFNLAPKERAAVETAAPGTTLVRRVHPIPNFAIWSYPEAPGAASPFRPIPLEPVPVFEPISNPAPAYDWPQRLAILWTFGVLLLIGRVFIATWRASRAIRRLDPVENESALELLRSAGNELNVRRLPPLLAGDELFSPALVGFIRPKLLLPRDLLEKFDRDELRLIFLHELAHLKRRDVAVNWLATLLTCLHWPNPAVWLVMRRLRLERELACDEMVLSHSSDAERTIYGHSIVKLLETYARAATHPLPGGVGILEGKEQMKRRITMIAKFAKSARGWTFVAAALVVGLGVTALTDRVRAEADSPRLSPAKPDAKAEVGKPSTVPSTPAASQNMFEVFSQLESMKYSLSRLIEERDELEKSGKSPEGVKARDEKIAKAKDELEKATAEANETKIREDAKYAEQQKNLKTKAIRADELVTVSIMDLVGPGIETRKTARVDADGSISLPYVGLVKAVGLSEVELEKAVSKTYKEKGLMANALVVVSLPDRGESHSLDGRTPQAAGNVETPRPAHVQLEKVSVKSYEVGGLISGGTEEEVRPRMKELANVISGGIQVSPGSATPSVNVLGMKIVVTGTEDAQRQTKDIIEALRKDSARQIKAEDMTVEDIAEVDPQMANNLKLRDELQLQIERLKLAGAKPDQTQLKTALDMLKIRDGMISERAKWFREKWKGSRFAPRATSGVSDTPVDSHYATPATPVPPGATDEFLRRLWEKEYKPRIFVVNGIDNLAEIQKKFLEEVAKMNKANPAATQPTIPQAK